MSAQTLRTLGELLVDVHGQHAHQSLLRRDAQRRILDEHGSHKSLLDKVEKLHGKWADARKALDALADGGNDAESRLDYLRFQVEELAEQEEFLGNLDDLVQDHRRLSHGADIEKACATSLEQLHGEDGQSAANAINSALASLQAARSYDEGLDEPIERGEGGTR